jgi:phosphatidate cytidylyltransferase
VMVAVACGALWMGGIWFDFFVMVIGLICFAEFAGLVLKISDNPVPRSLMTAFGLIYIGSAVCLLIQINSVPLLLLIVGSVVCVDIFAYFFGRTIGGPKIAPRISPSKTWAGLFGGIVGATFASVSYFFILAKMRGMTAVGVDDSLPYLFGFGVVIAVLAQSGDFFESWMKRRAGVKDSSQLIPGHGGVFDRIDGMLPIAIGVGILLTSYFPHWLNR